MPLAVLRRGTALGLVLALAVAATALADEVRPDADQVLSGNQGLVNVGQVAPGASVGVNVGFAVVCRGSNHLPAGTTILVDAVSKTEAGDGTVSVTPGQIVVPAQWPAFGTFCTGTEPAPQVTPAHLALTAPTAEGAATFDVQFDLSEGAATNMIVASVTMTVVAPPPPPPADTTDPVLHGMPADVTVTTTGDGALVSWPAPTATDDTDTNPSVACAPASGSLFDLGSTAVTCTATDDAGNAAAATFTVRVKLATPPPPPPPATDLTGTWHRPLADVIPALIGRAGRTVPLKLTVLDGTTARGPADIDAPLLTVQRLDGCTGDPTGAITPAGAFAWADGVWQLNLDTSGLGTGCVRLTAAVGSDTAATAVIALVPDASLSLKGNRKR